MEGNIVVVGSAVCDLGGVDAPGALVALLVDDFTVLVAVNIGGIYQSNNKEFVRSDKGDQHTEIELR